MIEKRPSWKDILWTPIYDFVDERWGTNGLRLFAIAIALFPTLLLIWGWLQNRAQTPSDADESVLVVDLSDAVRTDLVAPIQEPEGSPVWKSELDRRVQRFETRFRNYVRALREYTGSVGAAWSRGMTAMAAFVGDTWEQGLRVMVERMVMVANRP